MLQPGPHAGVLGEAGQQGAERRETMADQSMEPRRIARKQKSRIATAAALAILGSSVTGTGASAQAIYVDPYAAVVAPDSGYVVRQTGITPARIGRGRAGVINRPACVPARVLPLPRSGSTEERYVVTDW